MLRGGQRFGRLAFGISEPGAHRGCVDAVAIEDRQRIVPAGRIGESRSRRDLRGIIARDVRNDIGDDARGRGGEREAARSEEHTSELQSLMRISYAVFCLKKKKLVKYILDNYYKTLTEYSSGTVI